MVDDQPKDCFKVTNKDAHEAMGVKVKQEESNAICYSVVSYLTHASSSIFLMIGSICSLYVHPSSKFHHLHLQHLCMNHVLNNAANYEHNITNQTKQGPFSKRKVGNGYYNKYICHPHTICIESCLYYSSQIKKIIKGFFLVHNINFHNQIPTLFKCTIMAWYPCNLLNSHLLLLRSQSQMICYKMSNKICSTFG